MSIQVLNDIPVTYSENMPYTEVATVIGDCIIVYLDFVKKVKIVTIDKAVIAMSCVEIKACLTYQEYMNGSLSILVDTRPPMAIEAALNSYLDGNEDEIVCYDTKTMKLVEIGET